MKSGGIIINRYLIVPFIFISVLFYAVYIDQEKIPEIDMSEKEQWEKLELIKEVAEEVFG